LSQAYSRICQRFLPGQPGRGQKICAGEPAGEPFHLWVFAQAGKRNRTAVEAVGCVVFEVVVVLGDEEVSSVSKDEIGRDAPNDKTLLLLVA